MVRDVKLFTTYRNACQRKCLVLVLSVKKNDAVCILAANFLVENMARYKWENSNKSQKHLYDCTVYALHTVA
jgi:hypothetical protein